MFDPRNHTRDWIVRERREFGSDVDGWNLLQLINGPITTDLSYIPDLSVFDLLTKQFFM